MLLPVRLSVRNNGVAGRRRDGMDERSRDAEWCVVHRPTASGAGSGTVADRTLAGSAEYVRRAGDPATLRDRAGALARLYRRDDHGLAFAFETVTDRRATTVGTPVALDVVWTVEGRVTRVARLGAWRDAARGAGEVVVELPEGAAEEVAVGDEVVVQSQSTRSTA